MARDFLPVERDQQMLLPPDMRSWLPDDHLVWFVIDAVDGLDLRKLEKRYRRGGRGRRAFSPRMLLTLLLYATSEGVASSRRIEARCQTDVAFRIICGTFGQEPDHTTICRFRQRHEADMKDVFLEVLGLAARLGMVQVGLLAVDGTKLSANAALDANRTEEALRAELDRLFAEAAATDAAEDAQFGEARGDELPPGLRRREDRQARLARALEEIAAEKAAREAAPRKRDKEKGEPKANPTDPDSRAMSSVHGFVQGYNAQFAVAGPILVAAWVSRSHNDAGLLEPTLGRVRANLTAVSVTVATPKVVADCGYWAKDGLLRLEGAGWWLLVPPGKGKDLPREAPEVVARPEPELSDDEIDRKAEADTAERLGVFRRIEAGELNLTQAARELGLDRSHVGRSYRTWLATDRIVVTRIQKQSSRGARDERKVMAARLADPAHRATYKERSPLAEGAIALLTNHRNGRRLPRRGLPAAQAEVELRAALHNLLKIDVLRRAVGRLALVPIAVG